MSSSWTSGRAALDCAEASGALIAGARRVLLLQGLGRRPSCRERSTNKSDEETKSRSSWDSLSLGLFVTFVGRALQRKRASRIPHHHEHLGVRRLVAPLLVRA